MPTFWANTLMDRNEVRERMQRLGRGPHGQRTNPTPPQHQHVLCSSSSRRPSSILPLPCVHTLCREVPTRGANASAASDSDHIAPSGPGLVENRARSADPFALLPPKTHTRGGRSQPPVANFARNDVPISKNNAANTQKHVVFAQHDPNVHNSIKNE